MGSRKTLFQFLLMWSEKIGIKRIVLNQWTVTNETAISLLYLYVLFTILDIPYKCPYLMVWTDIIILERMSPISQFAWNEWICKLHMWHSWWNSKVLRQYKEFHYNLYFGWWWWTMVMAIAWINGMVNALLQYTV